METNNMNRHCPEVEKLMGGKMPFVTRCGITLVLLVIFIVMVFLLLSEGTSQRLMKEMIKHTIEQIISKI